jgi:hypothetical protein
VRKNTEAFTVASKKTGLEVNAEKTKYVVLFGDHNAGQNGNIQKVVNPLKLCNSLHIWEKL